MFNLSSNSSLYPLCFRGEDGCFFGAEVCLFPAVCDLGKIFHPLSTSRDLDISAIHRLEDQHSLESSATEPRDTISHNNAPQKPSTSDHSDPPTDPLISHPSISVSP